MISLSLHSYLYIIFFPFIIILIIIIATSFIVNATDPLLPFKKSQRENKTLHNDGFVFLCRYYSVVVC